MEFDSDEELYMSWWLDELIKTGYIKRIVYQPKSFDLSKRVTSDFYKPYKRSGGKYITEVILGGHIYTTDFAIIWEQKAINIFTTLIDSDLRKRVARSFQYILCDYSKEKDMYYSYIEVKPIYDKHNMTREAIINQKWVWVKHGEFINIIIPQKWFDKTFTPGRYTWTDKLKQKRAIKYDNIITLNEYVSKIQPLSLSTG